MPRTPPKIGQYRHKPAPDLLPGADGVLRSTRMRRRFPYWGIVFLAYAAIGPLVCATLALVFKSGPLAVYQPKPVVPPQAVAPSAQNLLFGVGLEEIIVASGFAGYLLWNALWKSRAPQSVRAGGLSEAFRYLLGMGLVVGPASVFAALPIAMIGNFVRNGPRGIPLLVRPFFGILGSIPWVMSALFTGTIPVVLLLLGLVHGVVTALAVAYLWQHFPEEPVLK